VAVTVGIAFAVALMLLGVSPTTVIVVGLAASAMSLASMALGHAIREPGRAAMHIKDGAWWALGLCFYVFVVMPAAAFALYALAYVLGIMLGVE
jgi:hypothetical protein